MPKNLRFAKTLCYAMPLEYAFKLNIKGHAMRGFFNGISLLFMLIGLFCLATPQGASAENLEIKLAVVTKPGSAQNIAAEKFKELIESRSSGQVQVTLYHSGALGTETEILQQLQLSSLHMAIITAGPLDAYYPEIRVISYPFLFSSHAQADAVLDGPLGRKILAGLARVGFKGLHFSENGFRHITNSRRPVHSVEDAAGLKIRVMESALDIALWRTLGANPTPMGWPIYAELQQGTIDAQENPISIAAVYKLQEVQKYLSLTGHIYSAHVDLANLAWFESLQPALQELVQTCMSEAAVYQRAWSRAKEAEFLAELKTAGMEVDEHPDLESFRARVTGFADLPLFNAPAVHDLLEETLAAARAQ